LSKDEHEQMALNKETEEGHFKLLMKLVGWAKELNLKPEELKYEVF